MPDRSRVANAGVHMLASLSSLLVVSLSIWLLWDVVSVVGEFRLGFLTEAPQQGGRVGGISTILVSTGWILAICLSVSVPLAVGTAIFLAEFVDPQSRTIRLVDTSVTLLASIPSVVFGLFGLVLFCRLMGFGISILSGGLTLACMVLPLLFSVVYSGLRAVPDQLRRAAAASGLSKTTMILRLLIPSVRTQALIGVVLATARALSETAALLFTSGYVTRMPESMYDSGRSISVHIFDMAMIGHGGQDQARLTALVLLMILCLFNVLSTWALGIRRPSLRSSQPWH